MSTDSRWRGLRPEAQTALEIRDYSRPDRAGQLAAGGQGAGQFLDREGLAEVWIPGVEIFPRAIYPQRHRGWFGEFAREGEGRVGEIGLWPKQWATARMLPKTSKGFHIHPPAIPEGTDPADWFQRLFITEQENHELRPYAEEQWDVMFFIDGHAEMFLIDERAGMERHVMRFFIAGDDSPGPDNVGVVIPPGVAHAIRSAGESGLTMVYGTSTVFDPANEGRIASEIEAAHDPEDWAELLGGS